MTVLGCWFWDNRFGNIQRFGAGAQSLKEPIDIVWSKQGFYAVSGSMLTRSSSKSYMIGKNERMTLHTLKSLQ
jgi:hypothetical protein